MRASELIPEGVLAVEMGATARDLAECVHPHPTLSETLMEALASEGVDVVDSEQREKALTKAKEISADEHVKVVAAGGLAIVGTERRVPLTRGSRFVVDTQRLWHVVVHNGTKPRYGLITSVECTPHLQGWIDSQVPALV